MLGDANYYLNKKADQLGLGRAGELEQIQAFFDALYPGQTRALKILDHEVTIVTPNASMASELRLRQLEFIKAINKLRKFPLRRIKIQIRGMD